MTVKITSLTADVQLTVHVVDGNEFAETDDHERIAGGVVVQQS